MIEGATVPQGYPRAVRVAAFVKGGGDVFLLIQFTQELGTETITTRRNRRRRRCRRC